MEERFLLNSKVTRFGRVSLSLQSTRRYALVSAVSVGMFLGGFVSAQVVKAPRYSGSNTVEAPTQQINLPPLPPAITPHGVVVEDVVVRVNDQIISRSDVVRAEQQLEQEAAQNHGSPPELAAQQKNMLRDMIDKQLLLSRAKELGLNADADVIRQLDDIRKQNKMDSLDDLEKAAKQQGISFEDFKAQIRNQILTQQVVRDEVGRRLQISQGDEAKFYAEHKSEFTQPEQVRLSEILIPLPETASQAEISQAEAKANDLKSKVMTSGDFADLAKKFSGGPSAAQGGELGLFKRGALAKVLEDQTFDLKVGESTQPIRTRQGFVILKVTEHVQEGPAPMTAVEPQIQEAMYMQAMQPALRAYLTKAREQAYIDVQPGFVDSGASANETKPVFTAYAPPVPKKKKPKQTVRFDRGGRFSTAKTTPEAASPDTTGTRTLTGADSKAVPVDPNTGMAAITAPVKTASGKAPKMMRKEKIRFGQAPRTALSGGTDDVATTTDPPVTPGAIPAETLGSATTPTAPSASTSTDLADNPLTPRAPEARKTRFSARAQELKERKAQTVGAKKLEKVNAKPIPMTAEEQAASKVQAAPLGLGGDTSKKPKKARKVKGAPKERLAVKEPKARPVSTPVDQTASPSLAPTDTTPPSTRPSQTPAVPNSSVPRPASNIPNDTTLPPVTQPTPGAPQQGTPVPPPGV
jgi:peptidyl-prolyl cis-trans isomerase SurA